MLPGIMLADRRLGALCQGRNGLGIGANQHIPSHTNYKVFRLSQTYAKQSATLRKMKLGQRAFFTG